MGASGPAGRILYGLIIVIHSGTKGGCPLLRGACWLLLAWLGARRRGGGAAATAGGVPPCANQRLAGSLARWRPGFALLSSSGTAADAQRGVAVRRYDRSPIWCSAGRRRRPGCAAARRAAGRRTARGTRRRAARRAGRRAPSAPRSCSRAATGTRAAGRPGHRSARKSNVTLPCNRVRRFLEFTQLMAHRLKLREPQKGERTLLHGSVTNPTLVQN